MRNNNTFRKRKQYQKSDGFIKQKSQIVWNDLEHIYFFNITKQFNKTDYIYKNKQLINQKWDILVMH